MEPKNTQFDYPSNLVIQRESGPRGDEPTGEPESLAGKYDPQQMKQEMGRFAAKESARTEKEKRLKAQKEAKTKTKKNTQVVNARKKTKIPYLKGKDVLNIELQENLVYKPKTKENRIFYENLLAKIYRNLADEPQENIRSAADEVLAVLKSDHLKDVDKKREIEAILQTKIDNDYFNELYNISKEITDYIADIDEEDKYHMVEEEMRINVQFEDEIPIEEEEEIENNEQNALKDNYQQSDESDINQEIDEDGRSLPDSELEDNVIQAQKIDEEDDDDFDLDEKQGINRRKYNLDVSQIDAYWLQQNLNTHYNDPIIAQKMETEIMKILNVENDTECENKLVMLLNTDKFELIKLLIKNRHKIFYCTRLGQAQNLNEKDQIMTEMKETQVGQQILENIERIKLKKDKEKENIKNIQKEAAALSKKKKEDQTGSKIDLEQTGQNVPKAQDEDIQKLSKKIIDLEALAFNQGNHYMSNEKCELPQGSYKMQKKGYVEIHIPAIKQKEQKEKNVQISELPEWCQPTFDNIKELNRIQSKVFQTAFTSPENMLVCAPTGAGKTNIALLTMLQTINNYRRSDGSIDKSKFKLIYIAPMKALVAEIVGNFKRRLECLGIEVKELTGDMQLSKQQIQSTQLIVATPEKWDIITRKSGEKTYTELVKLIIIDEIHLLHDSRGPVIEALVARTIRMIESNQEMVRIVGLSATLPNYIDVAAFLRVNPETGLFFFDNSYRPIPLEQQYIGITEKKAVRKMLLMNEILYEKVIERAGKYQMIIFVHSRRETVKTMKAIKEMAYAHDELNKFLKQDSHSKTILASEAENVQNQDLKELLPFGFAIHHAGLHRLDRNLVEDLFADKHIQVLVSTSTLAWGVNLPAHTVIIKGTQIYSPEKGQWVELSPQDMLQMMGRAGRPRYDQRGEGIIITSYQELKFYLSLLNQQLPIESQFISQLTDQLNAEITLGSVYNLKDAVNWLAYSYLYIRMMRAPPVYNISDTDHNEDPLLLKRRSDLIHSAATLLDKHNLIKYDKKTGQFTPTALGKIASHYYIKYPSITIYNEHIKPNMGMIEIFKVFSLSSEFKYIPIREEEKVELQKLLDSVPLPVKGSPTDPTTKVNVLLQTYVSQFKLDAYALNADMVFVQQSAGRIVRALFEIFLKKGWAQTAQIALNICKMVDRRIWPSMTPLRQFKGIPEEILHRIEKKEQFTWDHFYSMSQQQIGELIKYPKLGKVLHKFIHQFPRIELTALVQPVTRSVLKIDLSVTPDFQWDEKIHGKSEPFWIMVEDCDSEMLLYSEYFILKQKKQTEYIFEFTVPLFEPLHPIYYIKVISDRWLNCEACLPISFKNLILPEKFSAPTDLLDRQLLPVSAVKWTQAELFLQELGIKEFWPIQTQVFTQFYNQDDTVFLGASSGSGKTICGILTMLRQIKSNPNEKIVYTAPIDQICIQKYKLWAPLFKRYFNSNVCLLTGTLSIDSKLLENNDVIISTAQNWDILSRRWKQRKALQKIGLFIADELHLLQEFPVQEVIVSRMRYVFTQLEKKLRIVALAASVANYKDLSEWIGAQIPQFSFNFHSSVRTVPLDIVIHGFDQVHRQSRLLQMHKQLYSSIKQHGYDKSVMIFVADRKQARLTALDLVANVHADDNVKQFLNVPQKEIQELSESIKDRNLKHTVQFGIGFLFEGMNDSDREVIENLYKEGFIQILICTYNLCWDITLNCHVVFILETQIYDGVELKYIDYSIPSMLQMIGRAQKEQKQQKQYQQQNEKSSKREKKISYENTKCIVFCHTPKKDFYKKFLHEPFPVESNLKNHISDHLNTETVAKTITSKQDCVDWLTWTFLYRRLTQNPNFYGLQEISGTHINDFLSEIIEATVEELETIKCVAVEDEVELMPLNLGIIASYYYIKCATIDHFFKNLNASSKMKDIHFILTEANEFQNIQIRHREDHILKQLCTNIPFKLTKAKFNEPDTKTNILLQNHFSRNVLPQDFNFDQKFILENAIQLIQAIVDVISSNYWLKPAIVTMQLSQMIIQAMWIQDSPLLQIPHFTQELASDFKKAINSANGANPNTNVDIADFMNMEDDERKQIFQKYNIDEAQIEQMAEFCNQFPIINMECNIIDEEDIQQGQQCTVQVILNRDSTDDIPEFVNAPYYPKAKEEFWWVLIGDNKNNKLFAIKRVNFKESTKVELKFEAPEVGTHNLTLYLICDSYIGCDKVEQIKLNVKEALEEEEEENEEEQN